ncbi:hypothetical protein [Sulfitobacter sp.]|uniref:hypothetical protein n=1 Tax=Sulfitobacter sp. TaxID=1903071 RepID=UPI00300174A0
MTTWTSKHLTALCFVGALGACDVVDSGNTLLAGLAPPADTALPAVPLKQALMMRGKVTLVPPGGYCIDPESLSQSFALMARCDALGAATGGSGAPVGVMTVSFARVGNDVQLPTAQEFAAAAGLADPENTHRYATGVIFRTSGTPLAGDLSPRHWRAISKVGAFSMGAALFGPEGRRAVSEEGAEVLQEMIQRTTDKTNPG